MRVSITALAIYFQLTFFFFFALLSDFSRIVQQLKSFSSTSHQVRCPWSQLFCMRSLSPLMASGLRCHTDFKTGVEAGGRLENNAAPVLTFHMKHVWPPLLLLFELVCSQRTESAGGESKDMMEEGDEKASCDKQMKARRQQWRRRQTR